MYFPGPTSPVQTPVEVSGLLGCPVLLVSPISAKSIKVKIPKISLFDSLQSSDPTSHLVYAWKNRVTRHPTTSSHPPPSSQHLHSIQIATWNCRGLHNSIPYIKHLLSKGVDILVLQEHWLWPFELDQLGSIDPEFAYTAVCDSRLSPSSTLTRGCGGCSILWRKSTSAVPISNLDSDRICGIQLPIEGSKLLTIIGAYMPSSEYPQETYNNYITAVNQAISTVPPSSPLLLVGDLNCHIGKLGGPRSSCDPNHRGVQWMELIENHSLYIPSLSTLATGPVHTFHVNRTATTVDYVIGNLSLSTVLVSCRVEEDHPLNTSDHLPIVSKLNLNSVSSTTTSSDHAPRLDWDSGRSQGCISHYASLAASAVIPLINKDYDFIKEIEADITRISCQLVDAAQSSIPPSRHPKAHPKKVYDSHLSTLCWRSRVAFRQWKAAGSPRSGPLYDERKKCKKNVRVYLSQCQAQLQRKVIQKRDQAFHSHHPKRFKTSSKKSGGTSLLINGSPNSDPSCVLPLWADHFSNLSTSRLSNNPSLQEIWNTIPEVEIATLVDEESILDVSFVPEEVDAALNRLKRSSSAGPDSLSPQHLIYAGPLFRSWLCKIFNAIVNLEAIPSQFKVGIIVPIYKGKGKDPLLPGSYRGITLTSVIAKTFEYLLLDRMLPVLSDNCVPHLNQTAYQRGVSSTDATFSCQETISKFIRDGDSIYSCFYDLASAFDTVEYPVLLSHLKRAGVSGKAWRLIKDWYTNVSSSVRVGRQASPSFSVSRGVRQGSVLSPTLFLMVMDPILLELNKRSCGPSVCGLYLGAFSHADDIRTLSTNIYDCKLQMTLVSEYASSQGLALNVDKCEASISPSLPVDSTHIHTGDLQFPLTTSAKCLGALWSPNLSCTKWIEENIKKARRAFFARGSGVFHGTLNPLSSKSIVELCVLPCLLFGAETWILNLATTL